MQLSSCNFAGRLGNRLLQLSHALHLAESTHSEVIAPEYWAFSRTHWDFRLNSLGPSEYSEDLLTITGQCQVAVENYFFESSICPSYLDKSVFNISAKRRVLQTHVLPSFHPPVLHSRDSVVVHIRGGDIFQLAPPGVNAHYTQPPWAFYKMLLDLPELSHRQILLCIQDHVNPVVDMILERYADRSVTVTDLEAATSHIVGATHLILGQSSFSEALGMLAPDLGSVYVPFCIGREGIYEDLRTNGWGIPGYCFEYDDYIPIHSWRATTENLQRMKSLTEDKVHMFPLQLQ